MKISQTVRSLPIEKRPLIELLSELRRLGVKLFADGGRLRSRGPQGVLTSALRQEISARKGEILAFLQKSQAPQKEPIRPRSAGEYNIPLSFAQQRLWFLEQLEGDAERAPYNEVSAVKIEGALDLAKVERCLREIVERHEILRTTFPMVNGVPRQVIAPTARLIVDSYIMPSGYDEEARIKSNQEIDAEVLRFVSQETLEPFDLERGPLLRVKVIRFTPLSHVLLLTMPHIIGDAWSAGIFSQEFVALYDALGNRPLPALPIQYADFSIWQRELLDPKGEVQPNLLAYWTKQLEDAPPLLELPTDHPRPPRQSYRGSSYVLTLPKELSERLQALSVKSGTTLFMTLLAAFKVLLMRYSGQQDILVGTPTTNRNREELESLIGLFVNTLALRTDLSGNPTFLDLLGRVRQVMLGGYKHKALPFAQLMEALQLERTLSYNPLIQVMFALQNIPQAPLGRLSGLTLMPLELPDGTAKFDLTLEMEERAEGLIARWEYNSDLFESATIERMAAHFQLLLEGIVGNPSQPIEQLPLLTEAERHQLLVEWNDTPADYPTDQCIHHLFEEQVERTPDATAVVFGDDELSYRELNAKANQLAHYLIRQGVGPEVLVGLYVERGIRMVVGLLAILKAGGAYVSIDTAYPSERIAFMLSDSSVKVLLTEEKLLETLPETSHQEHELVCLDRDSDAYELMSMSTPESGASTENLAYIIYTSGSTGRPKGVMVSHSNVVRLFKATEPWYHFDEQDVWTLFHSIAFDFSVWELWGALLYGGRLVVVPYLISRSPEAFYDLLCTEQVTVLNQTPSAFRQLIQAEERLEEQNRPLALRLVIFGGEALDLPSLAPWFERHGDEVPQLVNMYGITETTVHVTYRPLTQADTLSSGSMIGRAIPDLQLYILDQQLQPVPIGVPGELYVGGAGVARGYLNRNNLTSQRFVDDPFSHPPSKGGVKAGEAKTTLYKSGDLARYLPNRDIEYLGRIDHQVKIRGFRIELGEIEALLSQHEAVREVVVVIWPHNVYDKQLVAYLVCQPPVNGHFLRAYLSEKLPDYMVPSAFVQLDALPLTANGKVNRRALPAPDESSLARSTSFVAPRSETEEGVAAIWRELLRVEQVGIHDNFFELGGHSLLATQVISRIREAFEIKMPLRHLFESPTVASLAESIEDSRITKTLQTFSSSSIITSDEREEFAL